MMQRTESRTEVDRAIEELLACNRAAAAPLPLQSAPPTPLVQQSPSTSHLFQQPPSPSQRFQQTSSQAQLFQQPPLPLRQSPSALPHPPLCQKSRPRHQERPQETAPGSKSLLQLSSRRKSPTIPNGGKRKYTRICPPRQILSKGRCEQGTRRSETPQCSEQSTAKTSMQSASGQRSLPHMNCLAPNTLNPSAEPTAFSSINYKLNSPIDYLIDLYDNIIAPAQKSTNKLEDTARTHFYKRLVMDCCANELPKFGPTINPEELFQLFISICKNFSLLD